MPVDPSVAVRAFGGLAVQAAAEAGADFIVKGLRTPNDFDIEQQMAHTNHSVTGIRTVLVPCRSDLGFISSKFIREIAAHGEPIEVPISYQGSAPVAAALADQFAVPPTSEAPTSMTYDDRYDDHYGADAADDAYQEIDDDYPDPQQGTGYVGDAETWLRRAIGIVANAPTMPLSSSPRIDRDEIIELLDEALARLPEELRQARWMLKERQDTVNKHVRGQRDARGCPRAGERMVQRTEVVRAPNRVARQVIDATETDARR